MAPTAYMSTSHKSTSYCYFYVKSIFRYFCYSFTFFILQAKNGTGQGNKAGDVEGTLQDNVRDNYCMCDKSRLAFSYAKCACTVYMYRFNNL